MILLYIFLFVALHAPLTIYFHDSWVGKGKVNWKWLIPQLAVSIPIYIYIIYLMETI